jgi:hypothetical protein
VSASVRYTSGSWILIISDTTGGWSFSITIEEPATAPLQTSAEWIDESPTVCADTCTANYQRHVHQRYGELQWHNRRNRGYLDARLRIVHRFGHLHHPGPAEHNRQHVHGRYLSVVQPFLISPSRVSQKRLPERSNPAQL